MVFFAIPSAVIEAFVWAPRLEKSRHNSVVLTSLWVHLALVPVGLAILLIPEQPYRSLEAWSGSSRRESLKEIEQAIQVFISEKERFPLARTTDDLLKEVSPYLSKPEAAARAFTQIDYSRFSTGRVLQVEWQINQDLVGRKVPFEGSSDLVWYLRPKEDDRRPWTSGLVVDPADGAVTTVRDSTKLGY